MYVCSFCVYKCVYEYASLCVFVWRLKGWHWVSFPIALHLIYWDRVPYRAFKPTNSARLAGQQAPRMCLPHPCVSLSLAFVWVLDLRLCMKHLPLGIAPAPLQYLLPCLSTCVQSLMSGQPLPNRLLQRLCLVTVLCSDRGV